MDLAELTLETAKTFEGTEFEVSLPDGGKVKLKLNEALAFEMPKRPTRGSRLPKRTAFALYFLGPHDPVLPQSMYPFRSANVNLDNLFIVPVGRDEEVTEYEAVFA
jgi:hypothetical protein